MKFRKKPVVIEARQYDGSKESAHAICQWVGIAGSRYRARAYKEGLGAQWYGSVLEIKTLESGYGYHEVSPMDYVIRGVAGEFYPCKPEIFAETYEEATVDKEGSEPETNSPRPWICFHCGFETTDEAEAQAHFGERDDAEEFTPTCQWWKRIPDGERAQAYQQLLIELNGERRRNETLHISNEGLEYQVSSQQGAIKSYKPFRNCRTINDVFFVYDSMEGRALAAEEQVKHWEEQIRSVGYDGADEIVEALKAVRVHLDEKAKEMSTLAVDMANVVVDRDETQARYEKLLRAFHEREMATWKNVCDSEVFQDLKHGRFRDILHLLQDGEISVGKASESIIERANGLEPRLPERNMLIPDDVTWREVADELKWVLSRMTRCFDEGLRPRDHDSPAQQLVDEAKFLLVGYDEDAETERRAATRSGVNKWAKPLTAEIANNSNFGQ